MTVFLKPFSGQYKQSFSWADDFYSSEDEEKQNKSSTPSKNSKPNEPLLQNPPSNTTDPVTFNGKIPITKPATKTEAPVTNGSIRRISKTNNFKNNNIPEAISSHKTARNFKTPNTSTLGNRAPNNTFSPPFHKKAPFSNFTKEKNTLSSIDTKPAATSVLNTTPNKPRQVYKPTVPNSSSKYKPATTALPASGLSSDTSFEETQKLSNGDTSLSASSSNSTVSLEPVEPSPKSPHGQSASISSSITLSDQDIAAWEKEWADFCSSGGLESQPTNASPTITPVAISSAPIHSVTPKPSVPSTYARPQDNIHDIATRGLHVVSVIIPVSEFRSVPIHLHQSDNPDSVSANFCKTWKIPLSRKQNLANLLRQHLKVASEYQF
ncbi:hypothetical protein AYI68_g6467 [Smittium mucronatum]|uniref:Uncharacterized protein n=1 Tax=Smittium mucronatum TaxID=133383 RepID=A0A1R0GRF1_9FUNG|nr:hypothetical protein AYI68_g6467 [Smittium mucronatum]